MRHHKLPCMVRYSRSWSENKWGMQTQGCYWLTCRCESAACGAPESMQQQSPLVTKGGEPGETGIGGHCIGPTFSAVPTS